MDLLLASLIGVAAVVHVGIVIAVRRDAGRLPLDRRTWTAVALFVPVYGPIVYLLRRSELSYDAETDPYKGGKVNVHPSRADEVPASVDPTDRTDGDGSSERTPSEPSSTDRSDDEEDPFVWGVHEEGADDPGDPGEGGRG